MEQFSADIVATDADYDDDAQEWDAGQPRTVSGTSTRPTNPTSSPASERPAWRCSRRFRPSTRSPVRSAAVAAGYCLTASAISRAEIVGVQSAAADATYWAYHGGHLGPQEGAATETEEISSQIPFTFTVVSFTTG